MLLLLLLLPFVQTFLLDFFCYSMSRRPMKLGKLIPYGHIITIFLNFLDPAPSIFFFEKKNMKFPQNFFALLFLVAQLNLV